MRKLLILVLVLCMCFSCAFADSIPVEENVALMFNSWAGILGAKKIDQEKMVMVDNIAAFPCDGYDIMFFLTENNQVERAGIRLYDTAASGDFIMASMTMISILGEMDYSAYGMMLFQYGKAIQGEEDILPWHIGSDTFTMTPESGNYKVVFVYLNTDLKLFV